MMLKNTNNGDTGILMDNVLPVLTSRFLELQQQPSSPEAANEEAKKKQELQRHQRSNSVEDALGLLPSPPSSSEAAAELQQFHPCIPEDAILPSPPSSEAAMQLQQLQSCIPEDAIIPTPPNISEAAAQLQQLQPCIMEDAIIPLPPSSRKHSQADHQDDFYFAGLPTDLFADEKRYDEKVNGRAAEEINNTNKRDRNIKVLSPSNSSAAMIVSPGNSRTTWMNNKQDDTMLWGRSDSFKIMDGSNQQHRRLLPAPTAPPVPPQTPKTCQRRGSLGTTGGVIHGSALYGSFSSSTPNASSSEMMKNNMWQYDGAAAVAAAACAAAAANASPRTTDAVRMMPSQEVWSPSSSQYYGQQQDNINPDQNNNLAMIPSIPSLAYTGGGYPPPQPPNLAGGGGGVVVNTNGLPSLPLPNYATGGGGVIHHHHNGNFHNYNNEEGFDIPAFVSFMVPSQFDFDVDDDVSLLADDPDDDEEGVLPNATYDVLATTGIFNDDDEQVQEY